MSHKSNDEAHPKPSSDAALLRSSKSAKQRPTALDPQIPNPTEDASSPSDEPATSAPSTPRQDGQSPLPDAFPGQAGRLPNNPLVAAGMAAIWKGGPKARSLVSGWRSSDSGRPVYQHTGGSGGRILAYPNPVSKADDPIPTTETLWNYVEKLNPFTADVAFAVLAQLCEPSVGDKPKYPLVESVRITADAILHYKGIQRWGMERRLLQERVFQEMERLKALHFDVERWPGFDSDSQRWKQRGESWQGDRLFDIVKVEAYQQSLFGEKEVVEVSWLVRAGQWAYWWLNAQGRVYIARMARVLLELDHQGAALAKKLGQRIVLLGGALRTAGILELRIDHLLEDIGELPNITDRGPKWASRTRGRFDNSMFTLRNAGVFSDVTWPNGSGPDDPDRTKGWVTRWLAAKIHIVLPEAPPELPKDHHQALPSPRASRRHPRKLDPSRLVDGPALRKARIERGWSQQTLASHLGISVTYLSLVETGKRPPSTELASKIRAWIAEQ